VSRTKEYVTDVFLFYEAFSNSVVELSYEKSFQMSSVLPKKLVSAALSGLKCGTHIFQIE
jgi:hypothetical protein